MDDIWEAGQSSNIGAPNPYPFITSSDTQDDSLITNVKNALWNPDFALDKEVEASSVYNGDIDQYGPHMAVASFLAKDYENARAFWASDYEEDPWLIVDFGQPLPLKSSSILWERYPAEYKIQLSNDASTWEDATSIIHLSSASFSDPFPAFTSVPAPHADSYVGFDLAGCPARDDVRLKYGDEAGSLNDCLSNCTSRWDCNSVEYKSGECRNSASCDRLSRSSMLPGSTTFYLKKNTAPAVDGFRGHDTGGPDSGGNDLGKTNETTVDACAGKCLRTSGCNSFQYKKIGSNSAGNNCLLSESCDSFSRTQMQGSDSSYFWYLNKGVTLYAPGYLEFPTGGCLETVPGNWVNEIQDLGGEDFDTPGYAEMPYQYYLKKCAAECDKRSDCVSFMVRNANLGDNRNDCILSSTCERYDTNNHGWNNWWWYLRTAPPYVPGYDAHDSKICTGMTELDVGPSRSAALTEADCALRCDKRIECKAFIFYKRGTSAFKNTPLEGTNCRLLSTCEGILEPISSYIPESDQNYVLSDFYEPYFLYLTREDSARGYLSEVDFSTFGQHQYARISASNNVLAGSEADDYVGIYSAKFFILDTASSKSKW